ncbi:uncharacterized protein [Ptychodera flava]|uniref:uncharacterized protein isoform X2 n=1 Tax=Ptychodera flava TaxID=63121 RepID=UPI00396A7E36
MDVSYHSLLQNVQSPSDEAANAEAAAVPDVRPASLSACQLQRQNSMQHSLQPFVDTRGIDPDKLPVPEPPPLECTCGRCSPCESQTSALSPSDYHLSQPSSSCLNHSTFKDHRKSTHKASQSSPLPINTESVNFDSKGQKQASSFGSVSTTSCNLSTGTFGNTTSKVSEYQEYLIEGSIDSDLLEKFESQNMKETKELTPQEKKQRMQMYALTTMNHKKYKEIVSGTNDFDHANKLGEGAFGIVYKAILNETPFAVKRLLQNEQSDFEAEKIARKYQVNEIVALLKFRHTNIVPLCFYSLDGPEPCLVYEFMHNGSLQDKLCGKNTRNTIQWRLRLKIAMGSARGIQFLHNAMDKPLIHGDIKSANILLDKHNEPKIGDFGLAREGPKDNKSYTVLKTEAIHGTINYLPSEFLRSWKLSTKVDTFSFGVVLYEILTGQMAFEKNREEPNKLLMQVVEGLEDKDETTIVHRLRDPRCPDWPSEIVMDFVKIARKCTLDKPKARPEVKQVLDELVRLDLKVQKLRDIHLGKQPVQNTEPYQVPKNEGESEAPPTCQEREETASPRVPERDVPARVASEDSSEPTRQGTESEESPTTELPDQQNAVAAQLQEMTLEEKAAAKQREIEGEAPPQHESITPETCAPATATPEQSQIQATITLADLQDLERLEVNAAEKAAEIEGVPADKKGAAELLQDSGTYSESSSERSNSEGGHRSASEGYASTATDVTQVSGMQPSINQDRQLHSTATIQGTQPQYPNQLQLQQQAYLISSHQGTHVPGHRLPTESTDDSLQDRKSTPPPDTQQQMNQNRQLKMPPPRPEMYVERTPGYEQQNILLENAIYQQSPYNEPRYSQPRTPLEPRYPQPTTPIEPRYPQPTTPGQSHHPPTPTGTSHSLTGYPRICQPIWHSTQYPAGSYPYHPMMPQEGQRGISPLYGMQGRRQPYSPVSPQPYGHFQPPFDNNDPRVQMETRYINYYDGATFYDDGDAFIDEHLPCDPPFKYYPPRVDAYPNQNMGYPGRAQEQMYHPDQVHYQQKPPPVGENEGKPKKKYYTPQKPLQTGDNNNQNTKTSHERTAMQSPQSTLPSNVRTSPQHTFQPALSPDPYQQQMREHQQVFPTAGTDPVVFRGYPQSQQGMGPRSFQGDFRS